MTATRRWLAVLALGLAAALSGAASQAGTDTAKAAAASSKVTMYVMPDCGYCEKARQLLTQRGVQWQELDIASSAEASRDFQAKGGQGTPMLVIGEEVIRGLDSARIDAALRSNGLVAR